MKEWKKSGGTCKEDSYRQYVWVGVCVCVCVRMLMQTEVLWKCVCLTAGGLFSLRDSMCEWRKEFFSPQSGLQKEPYSVAQKKKRQLLPWQHLPKQRTKEEIKKKKNTERSRWDHWETTRDLMWACSLFNFELICWWFQLVNTNKDETCERNATWDVKKTFALDYLERHGAPSAIN